MKLSHPHHRLEGSALATALIVTAFLSVMTASVLFVSMNRRQTVNQSSVWQEALTAAEAGVHQGVAQLERALSQNELPTNSGVGAGQSFTLSLPHSGEDSTGASAQYTLKRSDVTTGGMLRPYYSIVSTGSVLLPGRMSISGDKRDVVLRKLNLVNLAAGSTVRTATRTVEAWVRPSYNTDAALKTDGLITLNNFKIYIDSFDSNDATRSLTGGQPGLVAGIFNVAPYKFISAGDATIYGDALTNGGTVGGSSGIQGEIRDDYYEPMAPVYPPSWATTVTPGVSTSKKASTLVVREAATIRGGTAASPARYVIDSVSLSGNADILTFDFGVNGQNGTADYTKSFVELYVRGDFATKGGGNAESGSIVIKRVGANSVTVKLWVLGNLDFTGNGMSNQSGLAANFSLYGVNAPTPTVGQEFKLAGNARFFGSVYAPGADLKLAGGGSDGTFVGSLSGKTAFMNGNTSIRYDEALSGKGLITRFSLVSWFEDTKKQGAFTGTFSP